MILTDRERQVVALSRPTRDNPDGLSDKEIASLLGCSRRTVEAHWRTVYLRTGCHSRRQVWARLEPVA